MVRIFDELYSWGSLRLVVFTGGESFLLGKELKKIVNYVAIKGISTRIVTNAYWAKSKEKAVKVLNEYKKLGLSEINISCDDYHQEFIPLKNIKNANDAALEVGIPALLAHRRKPGGKLTVEYLSEYLKAKLHVYREGEKNPDNNVICTGRNVPIYSTSENKPDHPWEISENRKDWMGACKSILKSIVITPDLNVNICCGIAYLNIPELSIGSLRNNDLLSILKHGNNDLITNWLALEGPSAILNFVLSKDPRIKLPDNFVNRCHLCNELFTREDIREILKKYAMEQAESLMLLRGSLDWIGEVWASKILLNNKKK
jgi:hypothetical protein